MKVRGEARRTSTPRDIELVAFTEAGRRELGLRIWDESRQAAEQAWKDARARLRAQYGARNPHGGWPMFVLFLSVLFGAFAAGLASGFRTEPAETTGVLAVLAGVSAVADLIVLGAVGLRPLNWAAIRMQIGIAITLGLAAAFHLSRPPVAVTPLVVAAAVVGLGGLVLVLLMRALRPADRVEIDNAINTAVAKMRPEVDETAARIQASALAELSAEERERIVALRTQWAPSVDAQAPAGAMIISSFLTAWSPYLKKEPG